MEFDHCTLKSDGTDFRPFKCLSFEETISWAATCWKEVVLQCEFSGNAMCRKMPVLFPFKEAVC